MKDKMGFNATWSMVVGGMVGSSIFSVLGVVIDNARQWAWLSFILAGIISLDPAHAYSQLSVKYQQSAGTFSNCFCRKSHYCKIKIYRIR